MFAQSKATYMLNSGGREIYPLTIPVSASIFEVQLKTSNNPTPEYVFQTSNEAMAIKLNVPPFATFIAQEKNDQSGKNILVITSVNSPDYKIKVNVNGSDYLV